jgi:histidine ammonia-lyase
MGANETTHLIHLKHYTLNELASLVDKAVPLDFEDDVRQAVVRGADLVQHLVAGGGHLYGVNTGFGSLAEVRIEDAEIPLLQKHHVLSHAAGVGNPVGPRISRFVMLIKLLTFRSGRTGIGIGAVERLAELWNLGAIPVIPEKGTVGASGDLAPLAHMSLPLLGLGSVHLDGTVSSADVLQDKFGLAPLELQAKEGLALTNGIQYVSARAADSVLRLAELADLADIVASVSAQAFSASNTFADPLYHTTTSHFDRRTVAENIVAAVEGTNAHKLPTASRAKQDPYSFRCIPQVHGAARQLINFCHQTIENEVNGVSDNPLFFAETGQMLCGGNLHGQSTAYALDIMAMAATDLASISERRTYQLHSGRRGLPDFLTSRPGVNSGLMIIQYTAAALVNECKTLCHPASVDTIPTCQLQEDHVSMAGTAAYKLATIIDNLETVLAIELISAAQGAEMLSGLKLSAMGQRIVNDLREVVDPLLSDRVLADDIGKARAVLRTRGMAWIASLAGMREKK